MSISREASKTDPTRTTTLQREYARRLRGALSRINAAIRRGIETRDIFQLNVDDPPVFRFPSDADKQDAFMRWLRQQEEREVLTVIDRNENQYIRHSYQRGLDFANRELRNAGIDVPPGTDNPFNIPIHRDTVQRLYTRNYEELEGITSEMSRQISRELSDGFAAGQNPRDIARNITDRVNKVGKHRATVMARTEVVNAHAQSTLNRYQQAGVEDVTTKTELLTAGDDRVCAICSGYEGEVFKIKDARNMIPLHPQCRCTWLPVQSDN